MESNHLPGVSRSAGFRDRKPLPLARTLLWSTAPDSNRLRRGLRPRASTLQLAVLGGAAGIRTQTVPLLRRLPLPIGPRRHNWWASSDSNRDWLRSERSSSAGLG